MALFWRRMLYACVHLSGKFAFLYATSYSPILLLVCFSKDRIVNVVSPTTAAELGCLACVIICFAETIPASRALKNSRSASRARFSLI